MNLVVDVGNTRIKMALFNEDRLLEVFISEKEGLKNAVEDVLKKFETIKNIIISTVLDAEKDIFKKNNHLAKVHFVSKEDKFPFTNIYTTPKTLGIDRMILAAGAVFSFSGSARLVIDVGTCVTYDYIDKNNVYHGGAISPGLRLRYASLHNYTAKLPLLSPAFPENFIGNSTSNAIHSGVINGLLFEIDGVIDRYKLTNPDFIIILTGGDCTFFANQLKNTIFVQRNFLLESLNKIFLYQKLKHV